MPDLIVRASWNSLEIVKICVQALVPIAVVFVTLWLRPLLGRIERRQWSDQKLFEKRLAVFEQLATPLDEIRCYFTYVGNCNGLRPDAVLNAGRRTDAILRIYGALFSPSFYKQFQELHRLCFAVSRSAGDLRLRTSTKDRRSPVGFTWDSAWAVLFSDEANLPTHQEVKTAFDSFMNAQSNEIVGPTHPGRR
jgi:hypothetical protein